MILPSCSSVVEAKIKLRTGGAPQWHSQLFRASDRSGQGPFEVALKHVLLCLRNGTQEIRKHNPNTAENLLARGEGG